MKNSCLCGIFTAIFVMAASLLACGAAEAAEMPIMSANGSLLPRDKNGSEDWISIPSGARSAYIGIHGGTMPVSLLAARDGQVMAAFVGQTGNDFLYMLRRLNSGSRYAGETGAYGVPGDEAQAGPEEDGRFILKKPGGNATILMAATPMGTVPVIYASGQSFSKLDLSGHDWLPFGLSEKPLSMEGQVGKPLILPLKRHKAAKAARWRFGALY